MTSGCKDIHVVFGVPLGHKVDSDFRFGQHLLIIYSVNNILLVVFSIDSSMFTN